MATNDNTNDETEPRDVAYYLKKIKEKAGNKTCLFRGQANATWKLESGAARRIRQSIEANIQGEKKLPETALIFSQSELLEDARTMGFGVQDGRKLTDLELLTELQHFGAATCLLDFTENPLIALYMACKDLKEEHGQVYVLPDAGLDVALVDEKIDVVIEKSRPLKFIPHMQGSAERRIIRQSGVFIIGLDDKYEELTHVCIASKDKEEILDELASIYQISDETIFIDLSGFASTRSAEKRLQSHYTSFYEGLNFLKTGMGKLESASARDKLLKSAIEAYDKAIELKPDFVEAYNNRGLAKAELGQPEHDPAIKDYDEALRLKPDLAEAYNNRGNSKAELKKYAPAIKDYTEALRLKPDYAQAYNNRGVTKFHLGQYEAAIKDYTEALRLKPGYAEAYYNRGKANLALDQPEAAKEDLIKARELFQNQSRFDRLKIVDDLLQSLGNDPEGSESVS